MLSLPLTACPWQERQFKDGVCLDTGLLTTSMFHIKFAVKTIQKRPIPVRYEVNCFGPQRIAYRVVVLTALGSVCNASLGQKRVPSDVSPHHLTRTSTQVGGFATFHMTLLIVSLRKQRNCPSTRGGRLVDGEMSLKPMEEYNKLS